jgi:hypothetical protein
MGRVSSHRLAKRGDFDTHPTYHDNTDASLTCATILFPFRVLIALEIALTSR